MLKLLFILIGCQFPGAHDIQEYRKVLLDELHTYKQIPADKWSRDEWHSEPNRNKRGYINSDVIGNKI